MATRRTYRYTASAWQFTLSFWVVVIIGIAMAVVGILHVIGVTAFDSAANWIKHVCMVISLFIPVVMSWQVAKYKSTAWKVVWVICVILVVAGIILAAI